MSSARLRHRGGFTLAETVAAGTILALSAGLVGTSVSQALRAIQDARDFQQAARLLDQTLTRIDLIGPERLEREGPAQGRFAPPDERFTWEVQVHSRSQGHLYEVTVRVHWPTPQGSASAEAQTLLNDQPGSRNPGLDWSGL
jgi:type II secretory pathway pseudopilin PulG